MNNYLYLLPLLFLVTLAAPEPKEGDRLHPDARYMQGLVKRINNLCPGKQTPTSCSCDFSPVFRITPPLTQFVNTYRLILGCHPNFCRCPSGEEIDSRPKELRKLVSLCPRGELESCTCASDDSTVTFPFNLQNIFFTCRPYKCQCKNDPEDKVVTNFGCSKGGIPYCANDKDWYCENNTTMVTRNAFLHSKLDNKCMCKDGLKPRCRSHGDYPRCPGGEELDYSLGSPDPAFALCS